jgi:hypothetical protein
MLIMDDDPEPSWPVVAILFSALVGSAAGPAGALGLGAVAAAILSKRRRSGES